MTLLDLHPNAGTSGDAPTTAPRPPGRPVSSVCADLLPDEVRTQRRLRYLKRRMAFGLVALALIIGLGDALARQQTSASSDELATAQLRIAALRHQVARYALVVTVQTETQQITTLLRQAMAGDVPWAALTTRIQRLAPRGLTIAGIDAEAGTASAAPQAPTAGASGPTTIGSLTLTGTAPTYQAVADLVDKLIDVPGLTAVTPATAAAGSASRTGVSFTITAALTPAAQRSRYTPTPAAPSGSPPGSSVNGPAPVASRVPTTPTPPPVAAAPVGN